MSLSADDGAEARGELHRRPEEVAVVGGDGLTRADADADVEGRGRRRVARLEGPLDVDRELHGRDDRGERRHDAVTGVLDLVALVGRERIADQLVVLLQQCHVAVVARRRVALPSRRLAAVPPRAPWSAANSAEGVGRRASERAESPMRVTITVLVFSPTGPAAPSAQRPPVARAPSARRARPRHGGSVVQHSWLSVHTHGRSAVRAHPAPSSSRTRSARARTVRSACST